MRYSQKTLLTSPFHATGLLLTFMKSSENQRFSKDFRGTKRDEMGKEAWNKMGKEAIKKCK